MMVYAHDQPYANREISELTETEKIIADFFTDEAKVSKLIKFLSLEENKDTDKFDLVRAKMFKRLFRNHGDVALRHLRPHLEKEHPYRMSKMYTKANGHNQPHFAN